LIASSELAGQGRVVKGIPEERDVLGVSLCHDVPGLIVVILAVILRSATETVCVAEPGGPIHFLCNRGEIFGKVFVKADEINSQPPVDADEMMLRQEMSEAPDVLPRDPLADERIEIFEDAEMSPGKPLIAFHVAFLHEEKSGDEAIPRISDKGKLEALVEQFRGHHCSEIFQWPMPATPSEKALANGGAGAFRDMHEHALFRSTLFLNQLKATRMTNLEPDAR